MPIAEPNNQPKQNFIDYVFGCFLFFSSITNTEFPDLDDESLRYQLYVIKFMVKRGLHLVE